MKPLTWSRGDIVDHFGKLALVITDPNRLRLEADVRGVVLRALRHGQQAPLLTLKLDLAGPPEVEVEGVGRRADARRRVLRALFAFFDEDRP